MQSHIYYSIYLQIKSKLGEVSKILVRVRQKNISPKKFIKVSVRGFNIKPTKNKGHIIKVDY